MAEYRYRLRGEVDLAAVPQVRIDLRAVIDACDAHVLIDCTGLTFIDSCGIAALLEAHRALELQGRHLLIVNVSSTPRRVFDLLGLTDLLRYHREPSSDARASGPAPGLRGRAMADS